MVGGVDNHKVLTQAVELTKKPIKIIYIKLFSDQSYPANSIIFEELTNPKATDFTALKTYNKHPDDCVILPFSSGTTGMPKGVMLSHNNITTNSLIIHTKLSGDKSAEPYVYETTNSHQEVMPCVLPFFHIYGWTCTLVSKLAIGGKLVTLPNFRPDTFLNVLGKGDVSILHAVPPMG